MYSHPQVSSHQVFCQMIHAIGSVYLSLKATDMRKSFDGLLAEARLMLLEPYRGECVLFVSKNKRHIKALWGDDYGLFLISRRFEGGAAKTPIDFMLDPCFTEITHAELAMILGGANYSVERMPRKWKSVPLT